MNNQDSILTTFLKARQDMGCLRELRVYEGLLDFQSNDYLGMAKNPDLHAAIQKGMGQGQAYGWNGASGSRLISGNTRFLESLEQSLADFHEAEAGLLFGSGYDANLALYSALAQTQQVFFCDALLHASIIDGLRLGKAQKVLFNHNDLEDLENKLKAHRGQAPAFIVVESIYSMDGDAAPLLELQALAQAHHAHLLVDEAHAGGVFGPQGKGLVPALGLSKHCYARVITFGKAWGQAGAVVLGTPTLRQYLINFARPFIYSTAPSPAQQWGLFQGIPIMAQADTARAQLMENVAFFKANIRSPHWKNSNSAIQVFVHSDTNFLKQKARQLERDGFAVKAILYPTVAKGAERLRVSLQAWHQKSDIKTLIERIEHEA